MFNFLKRIYLRNTDEETLKDIIVINSIKPLIEGDPATIADVLAQFALDEINKELRAADIWKHLNERGFKQCRWNKDPLVTTAIEDCIYRNLPSLREATITGKGIHRDEAQIILEKLKSTDAKHAIMISGVAGVGKSVVILQVVEFLQKEGKPLLVFRVDLLNPTQLPDEVGRQLGLPASPANVLEAVAQGRDCVLVIDQLDYVSETSGRNPRFFDCISMIIRQALDYPNMHVLLVCRKFDLDNDPRLRSLIKNQGIADYLQIKGLSHEIIKRFIRNELRLDITRLNDKQLDLLSIPFNLNLLGEISLDHEIDAIGFKTSKDLYDLFWDRKGRLLRDRVDGSSRWTEIIFCLCDYMSEHQTLFAPAVVLDKFTGLLDAMVSEHILIKDDNKYAFFHQAFFDYAFARHFCAQDQGLMPFLQEDEQHLFRRAQVRQILLHERDDDFNHYISDLELMLNSSGIRFHLKKIVFALLGEIENPQYEEWRIISTFLNELNDPYSNEVRHILFGSVPWLELLNSRGQLKKWLADINAASDNLSGISCPDVDLWSLSIPAPNRLQLTDFLDLSNTPEINKKIEDQTISLLSSIQKDAPELVMNLIEPYIDKSVKWNRRISSILMVSNVFASKRFFDLFLRLIDKGMLDEIKELDAFNSHFWYAHKDLSKEHPIWACKFIGHYLNRHLMISLNAGQPNPFEFNKGSIPNHIRDGEIEKSINECASNAPEEFIREILPFILRVIGFTADRDEGINSPWYDKVWRQRYYYKLYGNYTHRIILSSMEVAMSLLAKTNPENFRIIAKGLEDLEFDTIHYLLIRAYTSNGKQFVEDAMHYLIEHPSCFETGYVEDRYKAVRDLLETITPHCSEDQITQLLISILRHYPDQGRLRHRFSQLSLLEGITPARRTDSVNRRLEELGRNFDKSPREPRRVFGGGFVRSPISETNADKMTDEQWLEAISRYDSEDHSNTNDFTDFIGGAYELSSVLEKQVCKEPARFAALVLKFPDDTNVHYFNAILRGIKDTGLDIKLILDVCRRCHDLVNKPCGRWICDLIGRFSEEDLPSEILDIVVWYAIEDPDPEQEMWRTKSQSGAVYYGGDIINAELNTVRGIAADAIDKLISDDKDRFFYLEPTISIMIRDPSIEVRSWVAQVLTSMLRHDRDLAVRYFQQLSDTEDILLSTHFVQWFLKYALKTHFSTLTPILKRMIASGDHEVAKAGARQICVASFSLEEAKPFVDLCINGTEDQRFGAAEVFAANLKENPGFCKEKLIGLFHDRDMQVRKEASSCFRHLVENDLEEFTDLADKFIESPAFESGQEDLIWAFENTTSKLPDITYKICKKFIDSINTQGRRYTGLEDDVSQLILRIYLQNKDNDLGLKCLDLIDIVIEKGSYVINRELANYDR